MASRQEEVITKGRIPDCDFHLHADGFNPQGQLTVTFVKSRVPDRIKIKTQKHYLQSMQYFYIRKVPNVSECPVK